MKSQILRSNRAFDTNKDSPTVSINMDHGDQVAVVRVCPHVCQCQTVLSVIIYNVNIFFFVDLSVGFKKTSCGILNDICMKHGETLKTKNNGTKKNNAVA